MPLKWLLVVACLLSPLAVTPARADENGGTNCAVCTLLLGLVEQYAQIHNQSVAHALSEFCTLLPTDARAGCVTFVDKYGPTVIDLFDQKETPDVICNAIGVCKRQTDTCRLFPPPKKLRAPTYDAHVALVASTVTVKAPPKWLCEIAPFVCNIINRVSNHTPAIDSDGDFYGPEQTLRGSDWRGKDCNDHNNNVHPGRTPLNEDRLEDGNCNGIHGTDLVGQSYEKLWCDGTGSIGIASLGDSATAHFSLPPSWVNASEVNNKTYQHLLAVVEDELDWPMLSATTGHSNSSRYAPDIGGPMDSIYEHLFQINRCNHRDYQNIGVNGARAQDFYTDIIRSLARNKLTDKPLLMEFALIGNDVCDHQHSIDHMTTPEEFYHWMNQSFYWLEAHVPHGSRVLSVGLVDGRVLYDSMHARIHPIGWTNKDVNYAQIYDFLNCLDISPCWGWMNSNETIRNLTTQRAQSLNAALAQLVKDTEPVFQNIKITYLGDIISDGLKAWQAQGGETWQLIELVDGFHPNQLANWWSGQFIVKNLTAAGLLPPVNPHNEDIWRKFGDQGGL